MTTTTAPVLVTVTQAIALADDLLAELAGHIGDRAAVNAVMIRWADLIGAQNLAHVSLAAVRNTFVDCLHEVTREDVPPGVTTFAAKEAS